MRDGLALIVSLKAIHVHKQTYFVLKSSLGRGAVTVQDPSRTIRVTVV